MGNPAILDDGRNVGFAEALFKPLSLAMLNAALNKHLSAILRGVGSLEISAVLADDGGEGTLKMLQNNYRTARILLVEDDLLNQEVALIMLKEAGIHADVADNGQKAVDMVAVNPYQLILMDMHMPVMDGIEATRIIRQLPHRQWVPILAMTANAFLEDKMRCLEAGMNDFVTKPVLPSALYAKMLQLLSSRFSPV